MDKIKRVFLALVMALGLGTAATPAKAGCCVFDAGSIVAAIQVAQSAIVSTITTRTELLRMHMEFGRQSVLKGMQGATQVLANEEARGAALVAETVTTVETGLETARNASAWQEVDACGVLAPSMGPSEALRGSAGLGGSVGRGGGGGGGSGGGRAPTKELQTVLNIAAGREVAPATEVAAAMAARAGCNAFADANSPNRARNQACADAGAGFTANNANGTPDADIRAETLFIGPQAVADPRQFKRRLTVEPDTKDQVAVEAYMRNLNTPVDLRQLKKAELQTDAGRQYMAFRDAYEARMALAERPSRALVANRMASRDLIPMLHQLSAGEVFGAHVKNYLTQNAPNWQTRGISVDEMFNMEAERRYLNPKWHLEMAKMPPETHQREQTQMMALQNVLLVRMLEKLDTLGVVNGQVAASQVRQEMLPQLINFHAAVAK